MAAWSEPGRNTGQAKTTINTFDIMNSSERGVHTRSENKVRPVHVAAIHVLDPKVFAMVGRDEHAFELVERNVMFDEVAITRNLCDAAEIDLVALRPREVNRVEFCRRLQLVRAV